MSQQYQPLELVAPGANAERGEADREDVGLLDSAKKERQEGPLSRSLRRWAQSGSKDRVCPCFSVYGWAVSAVGFFLAVSFVLGLTAVILSGTEKTDFNAQLKDVQDVYKTPTPLQVSFSSVTRVAFGSCTAYDTTYQVLWEQAVIPAEPHAWLWLGDMAYLDAQRINCALVPDYPACHCSSSYLTHPPYSCAAGDLGNARMKWGDMLSQPGYQRFLAYMCPKAAEEGLFPPPGSNPHVCPRPVLGIYDDHDFGWNDGNRRLPHKDQFKELYLDALGEPGDHPRRNSHRGAYWSYTLESGNKGRAMDVVMLDGRYSRPPLPCEVRRQWCEGVLQQADHAEYAWCRDFLEDTQMPSGLSGSCCRADMQFYYGWCTQETSQTHPLYHDLCSPSYHGYGMQHYVLKDGEPQPPSSLEPGDWQEEAPFCDVLGKRQRRWLEDTLAEAEAPVKLIVSGSVLMGAPLSRNTDDAPDGQCSGDDWECYRPAQLNLLHTIARYARKNGGCWVVLVGDYHMSDIKMATYGNHSYADAYHSTDFPTPIYQVMASGMTNSTANPDAACEGWRRDDAGLRPGGPCAFTATAAFGMVAVEWGKSLISLQIHYADGRGVAQELKVSLDDCMPIEP